MGIDGFSDKQEYFFNRDDDVTPEEKRKFALDHARIILKGRGQRDALYETLAPHRNSEVFLEAYKELYAYPDDLNTDSAIQSFLSEYKREKLLSKFKDFGQRRALYEALTSHHDSKICLEVYKELYVYPEDLKTDSDIRRFILECQNEDPTTYPKDYDDIPF